MKKIKIVAPLLVSIFAFASLVAPISAYAAVTRVYDTDGIWGINDNQGGSGNCVSPASASFTHTPSVTAGNLVVVTVAYKGVYASQVSTPPSDNFGDTYTFIQETGVNAGSNSSRSMAQFYTVPSSSGTFTVTVPCPPDQSNANELPQIVIHEYTGQSGSPIFYSTGSHGSAASTSDGTRSTPAYWSSGDLWMTDLSSVNQITLPTPPTQLLGTNWTGSCMYGSLKGSICWTYKELDSSDTNTTFGIYNFGASNLYNRLSLDIH